MPYTGKSFEASDVLNFSCLKEKGMLRLLGQCQ